MGSADGSGRTLSKNGGIAVGQWQQVVLTYDGTKGSLYFNGVLSQEKYIGGNNGVVSSDLYLGQPADRRSLFFKGDMDEIRLLNRAISATEVADLYRCVASHSRFPLPAIAPVQPEIPAGLPPPLPIDAAGLVAYYPFNLSAQDASGHGNHATVEEPVPVADRFGKPNAAYHFDGSNDRIVCTKPVDLPSGSAPRTVAGWFRSDATSYYTAALFGYGESTADTSFQLMIGPMPGTAGVFRVNGWGDQWDWRSGILPTPYLTGGWHHAAVTYEGKRVEVFLDGVSKAFATWTYKTNPTSITMGAETGSGGWFFNGDLDDVMIFSRVLTAQEVVTLAAN